MTPGFGTRIRCATTSLACAAAYLLPYLVVTGPRWRFMASTALILAIGSVAMGRRALVVFGLRMTARDVFRSLVVFAGLACGAWCLQTALIEPPLRIQRMVDPRAYVSQFFQVLNDELVLRAALLTVLMRLFSRPVTIVLATGALFAVAHRWIYALDGYAVGLTAVTTLFCLGTIANVLFIRFRHIGYAVAVHFAWNVVRFTATYTYFGSSLGEGATYNYIEGNPAVVGFSVAALLLVFVSFLRWVARSFEPPDA